MGSKLGTRSVSDGPVYSWSHIARLEAERNRRRPIEWVEAYIRVGAGVTESASSWLVLRVRRRYSYTACVGLVSWSGGRIFGGGSCVDDPDSGAPVPAANVNKGTPGKTSKFLLSVVIRQNDPFSYGESTLSVEKVHEVSF